MGPPAYQFDRPPHHAHRRRFRQRALPLVILLLALLVAGSIFWHDVRQASVTQQPVTGAASVRTIAGPQVYRSAYFQFTDAATWQYDTHDSTPTKLIYLSYVNSLPAHMLTVYVNQTLLDGDLATTQVVPVTIRNGNAFDVGTISKPCGSQYAPGALKLIRPVSLSGTTMLCVPDSPQFTVILGQIGGDYHLNLRRQNGQLAQYIIIYHNLTASPTATDFIRITKTFQAL